MPILGMLSLALLFVALVGAPTSVQVQQSSAVHGSEMLTSDAVDAAVAGHASAADQQRAELADLLSRDEVGDVACDRGIDRGRVGSTAADLSDGQVRAVSPLVT